MLVLVPTAAAVAVGAALVHGFVSSGSSPTAKREVHLSAIAAPPHKTVHGSSALKQKAVPGAAYAADTQLQALNIPRNRLVHADATLGVQVADRAALSRATSKATQIVARLGGYAQSVRYATAHGGGGSAYLALRVPVGHVQTAVARLETLGTLLSQQLATEDLQHQVTQEAGRITTLRATIASYEKALENPSLGAAQRVILRCTSATCARRSSVSGKRAAAPSPRRRRRTSPSRSRRSTGRGPLRLTTAGASAGCSARPPASSGSRG